MIRRRGRYFVGSRSDQFLLEPHAGCPGDFVSDLRVSAEEEGPSGAAGQEPVEKDLPTRDGALGGSEASLDLLEEQRGPQGVCSGCSDGQRPASPHPEFYPTGVSALGSHG